MNAILSRHNFILLGLRGQAKSRILRALTALLDRADALHRRMRDSRQSLRARSAGAAATRSRSVGDDTPIAYLTPDERYVEKLATPDVTIADLIGDIDPIKAARGGHELSSELTVHYGLLPRANRGIFAINELPDLAGKIQVGLFNIMQEGDVQIKGYPDSPAARRRAGLQRQPGRLHRARQDHHSAERPHRLGDPHALSGHRRRRHRHHRAGSLDAARWTHNCTFRNMCRK